MNGILLRMIDISGYLSNNTAVYDCQSGPFIMLSPSMTKYVAFRLCLPLSCIYWNFTVSNKYVFH